MSDPILTGLGGGETPPGASADAAAQEHWVAVRATANYVSLGERVLRDQVYLVDASLPHIQAKLRGEWLVALPSDQQPDPATGEWKDP